MIPGRQETINTLRSGFRTSGVSHNHAEGSNMAAAEQSKDLKKVLADIEKEIGKGSIMSMSERAAGMAGVHGISTGALSLDIALGGRGLPRARVVEIFGPEASGKTTIALHAVANAQQSGGVAAFIDAEHALDPSWAKRIGVDLDSLLVSQPSYAEEALKIVEMLVKSNAVDIIVIDSVAALVPKNEIDGEIGDSHVGLQARLMSQALRILTPAIAKTNTCIVFINQIRQKIGVMFGSPETTAGGLALKFYSSVRLDVRKIQTLKDSSGDESIGSKCQVKVVKNKIAPPFRKVEFEIMYDRGISWDGDLLDMAVEDKVIDKSGSWFNYNNLRLGQGREAVKKFLRDNPAVVEEISNKVLEVRGLNASGEVIEEEEEIEEMPPELLESTPAPAPVKAKRGKKEAATEE